MAKKIKFEITSFELGNVLPYGWEPFEGKFGGKIMGHEFTQVATLRLVKERKFRGNDEVKQLPELIWREKEFWYESRDGGSSWVYLGETDKGDLYQTAPGSPTWGGFRRGITSPTDHIWITEPGHPVVAPLRPKLLNTQQQGLVGAAVTNNQLVKASRDFQTAVALESVRGKYQESKLKQWWLLAESLASRRMELPCVALDRPGMSLGGGSGRSGGGFTSLSTSESRRRVLQFSLGVVGRSGTFTATQVLETIGGQPSISKFIIPGMDDEWCRDVPARYLAYWRSRLNPANVEDQTTELESETTLTAWEEWGAGLEARGLV